MKTIKINLTILAFLLLFSLSFNACKEEDPPKPTNDEELITTLKLKFYNPSDSSLAHEFTFRDSDGEGGNPPDLWDTIQLNSNTEYLVETQFFNESIVSHVKDINPEIIVEGNQHLVCYDYIMSGLQISYRDSIENLPLGLKTFWKIPAANKGTITVKLKHQPDGIKNGQCDVGATDIEVLFQLKIE